VDVTDLLFHPVRLRIVQAGYDGRLFTTAQMCARLSDVSRATVYRHVALLADGGLLEVADEQRVRGAVERRYRLRRARAALDADAVEGMTPQDHRRGFAAVAASLLAEFDLYLDQDGADPVADAVSYRQTSLWLTRTERAEMIERVRAVLRSYTANSPAHGRRHHLLATILFPIEKPTDSPRP
jgi:DNA-binding transcriptional ArsR family regulator